MNQSLASKIQRLHEIQSNTWTIGENRLPNTKGFEILKCDAEKAIEDVTSDARKLTKEMLNIIVDILSDRISLDDVEGFDLLTEEQCNHVKTTYNNHIKHVGLEHKKYMLLTKVWIDENSVICVRFLNDEWYHYYDNGTWG